jgi:hypothetical protein
MLTQLKDIKKKIWELTYKEKENKMKNKKHIMIKNYDYAEWGLENNENGQNVLAIYGIDDKTLNKLEVGSEIKWDDKKNNNFDSFIWNGKVYAMFSDFVLVYLC